MRSYAYCMKIPFRLKRYYYPKAEKEDKVYVYQQELQSNDDQQPKEQTNNSKVKQTTEVQGEIISAMPLSLIAPPKKKKQPLFFFFQSNKLFFYLFILPSFLSVFYFSLIASDIYVTESKFIVKTTENQSLLPESFAQMAFGQNTSKESYSVHDYILSRDSLKILNDKYQIKNYYSKPSIDFISKFPGLLFWKSSLENFHQYYQDYIVEVMVDPTTSISTLKVRSFDPKVSLLINQDLIVQSENLVNRLSERARRDMIMSSQKEVDLAKDKIQALSSTINQLRIQQNIENPNDHVAKLQSLYNEKSFADKQLQAALTSLESARAESFKKQVYLEKIANPKLPDSAMEPRRMRAILGVMAVSFIIWGIVALMVSGVREHQT